MTDQKATRDSLNDDVLAAVKKSIQAGAAWKDIVFVLALALGTAADSADSPDERETLLAEADAIMRRSSRAING